jgi:fatty-acyl-CoA synthase
LPSDWKSIGELEVRGPWVAGSYNAPDGAVIDLERFRDGWLWTGDVGTITPDGFLTRVDRSKDMIKSGGEWIASAGLENGKFDKKALRARYADGELNVITLR